jgi:hypothetical protein
VFYDPNQRGPYADGQEALEDVPNGGTLLIGTGTWDVATEGRIATSKKITLQGYGWWANFNTSGNLEHGGTVIDNTGDDVLDEPVVEFDAGDGDLQRSMSRMRDLSIRHEGPTSPVVRFRNTIKTIVSGCSINAMGTAPKCLEYTEGSFFARAVRNSINYATDMCVQVSGGGYAHEFYSNHIATGTDGATAFQTERQRTILVGGECAATGENGTAVKFYNPGTDGIQYGGYVVEPGIEHTDRPVVIDGQAPFNDVQLYHLKVPLEGDTPAVRFGATNNSKVVYPIVKTHHKGELVRWSEYAQNCGLITDGRTISNGATVRNEGAINPYISVTGSVTPDMLNAFPTGVPTTVEYVTATGRPMVYDGDTWAQPASFETVSPEELR